MNGATQKMVSLIYRISISRLSIQLPHGKIKNDEMVIVEKETAVCTSMRVAEVFGKEHKHVLESIRSLECSDEFSRTNYRLSNYKTRGKEYPMYLMTRDGFMFLAMGFTGAKAAQFKELYIRKFNEMEQFITSKRLARMQFPELTDNIKALHDEPKYYHYSNECDMINRIVLGMTAKEFKEVNNIDPKEPSIRPFLNAQQIDLIEKLQRADVGMLLIEPDFYKRKSALKLYYVKLTAQNAIEMK